MKDAAIVRSSIELARKLCLDVVGERVETGDVLKQLIDLGCTSAQGYYISQAAATSRPNSMARLQARSDHGVGRTELISSSLLSLTRLAASS